jgi:hypothetical protein
MKEDVPPHN